jgi:hypothetical protein
VLRIWLDLDTSFCLLFLLLLLLRVIILHYFLSSEKKRLDDTVFEKREIREVILFESLVSLALLLLLNFLFFDLLLLNFGFMSLLVKKFLALTQLFMSQHLVILS